MIYFDCRNFTLGETKLEKLKFGLHKMRNMAKYYNSIFFRKMMKQNHGRVFANRGKVVFFSKRQSRCLLPDLKKNIQRCAKVAVMIDYRLS